MPIGLLLGGQPSDYDKSFFSHCSKGKPIPCTPGYKRAPKMQYRGRSAKEVRGSWGL